MATEVINENYTIDLASVNSDAVCPYCLCETFLDADTIEIIPPNEETGEGDVYENTCTENQHKSIWKNHKQYKIV